MESQLGKESSSCHFFLSRKFSSSLNLFKCLGGMGVELNI